MSMNRPKNLNEVSQARADLDAAEAKIKLGNTRELARLKEKLPTLEARVANVKRRISDLEA